MQFFSENARNLEMLLPANHFGPAPIMWNTFNILLIDITMRLAVSKNSMNDILNPTYTKYYVNLIEICSDG